MRFAPVLAVAIAMGLTGSAVAHVERPSYWPDPAPDTSISPPTGGKVPKVRTLRSALRERRPGETRVVCKGS